MAECSNPRRDDINFKYDPDRSVTIQFKELMMNFDVGFMTTSAKFAERFGLPADAISAAFSKSAAKGFFDRAANGRTNSYRLIKPIEGLIVRDAPCRGLRPRTQKPKTIDHKSWKDKFLTLAADIETLLDEPPSLSGVPTAELVRELYRREGKK
jgi:hypothetical protein